MQFRFKNNLKHTHIEEIIELHFNFVENKQYKMWR